MTPDNPAPLQFLADGRVCLPSNADPAAAGHVVYGWSKHHCGLDLGRSDPSALVVVRDECFPEFTGRGFEQRLGPRRLTVTWQESIAIYSYTDLADHIARRLNKIPNWVLAVDASGLGAPFVSILEQAGIETWSVVMTAGSNLTRTGKTVNVAKGLLLENLATNLENGSLTMAHDLKGKADLIKEISSFELTSTNAGNLVLKGGGKGHNSDRAVALALALLSATHLDTGTMPVQNRLLGWR